MKEKLTAIADIATVAQDSAERSSLDPSVYARVFELIAALIMSLLE